MARHHLVLGELDGQIQRRRAVALDPLRGRLREPRNKLLQHHLVDDMVDAAFPGQQPSAAGRPGAGEPSTIGPAVLPQLQWTEALAVLLGAPADPLEDGSFQVVVDQEVLDWQLLRRQLRPPRLAGGWGALAMSVCGHPHAAAVFSKRSRNASGSSCGPIFCTGYVGGRGRGLLDSPPARTLPVHPAPEQLAVLPLVSGRGHRISSPGLPSCPSALVLFLVESRERLDDIRKWRSRWWGHDGSGVPASFPGFRHQCNKVRRKEGSGQGWLVKTQVCLFKTDKLTQVRTLRHPETSTLSFVSAITLCIRSDCFSLTARALESSLRLSLNCRSTAAFIRSPRQLLQSDTGDPHFALDPLTYRCLLSLSPAADFAEPRPPRHNI